MFVVSNRARSQSLLVSAAVAGILLSSGYAQAQLNSSFTEIASDPASGLDYTRGASSIESVLDGLRQQSLISPIVDGVDFRTPDLPFKAHGQPGIAIMDYDGDGDLDLYVSNGPGVPNSLFSSQLVETGFLTYVDVSMAAGVDATAHDGNGVCYGDVDNDGDPDLLVVGRNEPNVFFLNDGDGTFTEQTASGLGGGNLGHSACTMGDVNGDGLLDVFVANVWDLDNLRACFEIRFAESQHNQLYINNGDNTFTDVSSTSGIEDLAGLPPDGTGEATLTWAAGIIDIDLDGDLDIVIGDDQCAIAEERFGGLDRGYIHVLLNDGHAHFTDEPIIVNSQLSSSWMGLAFGDLNCDGHLDIFGSNFGDYDDAVAGLFGYELGDQTTRWLLGNGDGTFTDPTVGTMASVFGWGNGIFDYDNDGDPDIVYHGGIDLNFIQVEDTPSVLLSNNGCTANFEAFVDAFPDGNHQRRTVQGVALGDLDDNGFVDVVTVSSLDIPDSLALLQNPQQWDPATVAYADVFNPVAKFTSTFIETAQGFVWNQIDLLDGSLKVELNDGNNNKWVQITALGSVDLTPEGRTNRDGIGAVVTFTPREWIPGHGLVDGDTVMVPVMGGSSLGSQHSLTAEFGLGSRWFGRAEVIWPGGVRNRLYGASAYERITFPEIPCSYDANWNTFGEYAACVNEALDDLHGAGVLSIGEKIRLKVSAIIAYFDMHP